MTNTSARFWRWLYDKLSGPHGSYSAPAGGQVLKVESGTTVIALVVSNVGVMHISIPRGGWVAPKAIWHLARFMVVDVWLKANWMGAKHWLWAKARDKVRAHYGLDQNHAGYR